MRSNSSRSVDPPHSADRPSAAVVLAGGRGTRMGGAVPKVLVELAGTPLLLHVLAACRTAGIDRCVVVAGEHERAIRKAVGGDVEVVRQAAPRGTGDALRSALPTLADFAGDLFVLVGDAPLVSSDLLVAVRDERRRRGDALTLVSARFPRTPPYGRVVRGTGGEVLRIVEEAAADEAERAIDEVSTYPFCLDAERALPLVAALAADPTTGEVLLPDLVGLLVARGERVSALETADPWQTLGVNTPEELARAEEILRRRRAPRRRSGRSVSAARRLAVSAPGRLCLFGEHQDYLGLPVIAAAIDRRLTLSARATAPGLFHLALPDVRRSVTLTDRGSPLRYRGRRDYFRSVYNTLLATGVRWPDGWRGVVRSEIPINAGTSSSTALTVAWTRFLLAAADDPRGDDAEAVARLAHRAEVVEFGEPGGAMDHFACALGGVLSIDPLRGGARRVAGPLAGLGTFVLVHSLEPKDTLGLLARVKGRAIEGLAAIRRIWPEFDLFRTPLDDARERLARLPPTLAAAVEANLIDRDLLRDGLALLEAPVLDADRFGALLDRHQEQLRRLGVSTPTLDRLLDVARAAGALGGKLNGSGGGGCLFAYAPERAEAVAEAVRRAGAEAWIVRVDDGVRLETVAGSAA